MRADTFLFDATRFVGHIIPDQPGGYVDVALNQKIMENTNVIVVERDKRSEPVRVLDVQRIGATDDTLVIEASSDAPSRRARFARGVLIGLSISAGAAIFLGLGINIGLGL